MKFGENYNFWRIYITALWSKLKKKREYDWEAVESIMCDVIKLRLKRRIATSSWKGNQPLNIKTSVERPILKLGLSNFNWSFFSHT